MTDDPRPPEDRGAPEGADPAADGHTLFPLPGEAGIPNVAARRRISISRKGLLAVVLMMGSMIAISAFTIQRFSDSGASDEDAASKLVRDQPTAATSEPRKLEVSAAKASAAAAPPQRLPALAPSSEDLAEPIGVRRTGTATPSGPKTPLPEDAPILLVTTRPGTLPGPGGPSRRSETSPGAAAAQAPAEPTEANDPVATSTRNLQGYQRQLQGLLDNLTKTATLATGPTGGQTTAGLASGALKSGPAPAAAPAPGAGLFGGQLPGSVTPKVAAASLGNRSLTLPKGTAFTCALKTKVISATSGLVGCQVQRNVYSDDGRVLLVERGSHLDGEYRVSSVKPGTVRIPVLWTRIRTPLGVTVDIDSPGTGPLGESGIDGHVDNRWGERLGAALLLSLIDDSVKLVIQNQANESDGGGQTNNFVLPSTTANTSKLAEKVLESTINIPPLIYQNQGGIVGIYVARDVDFSSVYELQPTATAPSRP